MQFKKVFAFVPALAVLVIAAPGLHLAPASTPITIEEKRQLPALVGAAVLSAFGLAIMAAEVGILVATVIHGDIAERKLFTVNFIYRLAEHAPGKNIVICNVDYSLSCTPEAKETIYYTPFIGKPVSYDVVIFGKGCTFDRKGDGGYQNWAYTAPTGCQIDGGHISC